MSRPQVFKDKATNEIRPGDAVWFDPISGVTEVTAIIPPSRGADGSDRPGILTLEVQIPFERKQDIPGAHDDGKDNYVFGFLLVTKNPRKGPQVEQQISDILSGKVKPSATLVMPPVSAKKKKEG